MVEKVYSLIIIVKIYNNSFQNFYDDVNVFAQIHAQIDGVNIV